MYILYLFYVIFLEIWFVVECWILCLFFKFYDVLSDFIRKVGKCVFVLWDIKKCEVICEYEGEVLILEEVKRCEEIYWEEGKVCVFMVFESVGW